LIPVLVSAVLSAVEPGAYTVAPPDTSTACSPAPVGQSCFPVLCYHGVDSGRGLSVTPYRLRCDLQALYDAGFFLVTPEDLENGLLQVPLDRSPVMITFDDGWQDQYNLEVQGDGSSRLDPDCAVGVLESFCEANPDFGRGAVFFISWDKTPFGQAGLLAEKLSFLLDNGYVIGNHTLRHSSLVSLPPEGWESALTAPLDKLRGFIGLRTSGVTSVSWPGGRLPEGGEYEERLLSMDLEGAPVVEMGFLVDGALASLSSLEGQSGRLRISRVDMGLYSMQRLFQHRGFIGRGAARTSLHDPLPYLPCALSPLRRD